MFSVRNNQGAVEMLSGQRLPCDLSSALRNHGKMLGMASQVCNPVLGRQRQKDLWDWLSSQSGLIGEFQANERSKGKKGLPQGMTPKIVFWLPQCVWAVEKPELCYR